MASPEVSDDKNTKTFHNNNTISYGFGSNSTIRNSYNNSKASPMFTKMNWAEKPSNTRQLNMTTLDHIKNISSTPDHLTKNKSIQMDIMRKLQDIDKSVKENRSKINIVDGT